MGPADCCVNVDLDVLSKYDSGVSSAFVSLHGSWLWGAMVQGGRGGRAMVGYECWLDRGKLRDTGLWHRMARGGSSGE
jgi:hypothetical protein